ncbi:hypothetical protein ISN75_21230 [Dyella marensis]|uniref:DUF6438 domain-containing protein n=1 Tax=Dyella marensis TaxID=500610 RepID=UPI0031D424CC
MAARSSCLSGVIKAGLLIAIAAATAPSVASDNVEISLTRTACFGACPTYELTIRGDGLVHFTTGTDPVDEVDKVHRRFSRSNGVLLPGTHEDRISPEAVQALLKQFEAADFWQLKDEYRAWITDNPTQVVSLTVGGRNKRVVDYVGIEAGMPKAVDELEEAIDRAAGADRWVKGTAALIPWLEQNHFDFHSNQATVLAVNGEANEADEATILALIERGAPLDQTTLPPGTVPGDVTVAGVTLIEDSIRRGHAEVFKRLAKDGWLDRYGKAKAIERFADTGGGCSPAMVDAFADAGLDIDFAPVRKANGDDEPQGRTALAELAGTYTCRRDDADRIRTAERLLARGAHPNHRDSKGRTPLYGVENLELLNVLLSHGADASLKSNDGNSMLFGSWTDAIVLRLLEAGASPKGRYDDGRTLAQQAKARNMRRVQQWLAAHPEALRR